MICSAKAAGLRVADMLGGAVHERLPVMWTVGMDTPEANAEEAAAMQRQGFTSLMIKVAAGTVEQDAARVRAIREAVGPDYPLIADANQGWDVLRAVRFARLVEDCGLALLEQPVPPDDIDGLAEVRRTAGLRLSADESVHTLAQARHLIEKKAVDVFSIKVIKHGGHPQGPRDHALRGGARHPVPHELQRGGRRHAGGEPGNSARRPPTSGPSGTPTAPHSASRGTYPPSPIISTTAGCPCRRNPASASRSSPTCWNAS